MFNSHETILEVDLNKLKHNYYYLKSLLKNNCKIIAVVKAFAYGHGDVVISKTLEDLGVDAFWVADFEEGISLREGGIKSKIIVANPGRKSFNEIIKNNLDVVLHNKNLLDFYISKNTTVNIHIKFNTGMNRYGFDIDELNEEITDGYQLNFYTSIQDAENGTNEIENPESFENTTNPQEIFVKITTDRNCENIQSFNIETQFQPLVTISPYIVCEDSDDVINNNLGYFDFNEKMDEINTLLNVSETDQISFYDSYNNALTNNNPLESEYTSTNGAIWIIVRDENGSCGRIATMDLIVNSSINLDIQDSYLLCYLHLFLF